MTENHFVNRLFDIWLRQWSKPPLIKIMASRHVCNTFVAENEACSDQIVTGNMGRNPQMYTNRFPPQFMSSKQVSQSDAYISIFVVFTDCYNRIYIKCGVFVNVTIYWEKFVLDDVKFHSAALQNRINVDNTCIHQCTPKKYCVL